MRFVLNGGNLRLKIRRAGDECQKSGIDSTVAATIIRRADVISEAFSGYAIWFTPAIAPRRQLAQAE